jgi:hypothetical protein
VHHHVCLSTRSNYISPSCVMPGIEIKMVSVTTVTICHMSTAYRPLARYCVQLVPNLYHLTAKALVNFSRSHFFLLSRRDVKTNLSGSQTCFLLKGLHSYMIVVTGVGARSTEQ